MKCANCGQFETKETICEQCRSRFPGTPEQLEKVIEAFKIVKQRLPGFESMATGVKPWSNN